MAASRQAAWGKTHTTVVRLTLNNNTDKDILDKLAAQDNRQGYIKKLIRADISRTDGQTEKQP